MKKYKGIQLFVGLLVLGLAFYSPVIVKAEDSNKNDSKNNQVNTSDNQGNSKDNQVNTSDNQGNSKDSQEVNNDNEGDSNEFDGQEYMNDITTSTKNLLDVANKENGDVGAKIKEIVKEQDQNKNEISKKIDEIQNRSKIKTFLIGTDYNNIGQLKSDMVKTSDQIDQLNGLLDQTKKVENKTAVEDQIKVLEQGQQKIGDLLVANESKFSLFGWFMKLFSK